MCVCVFVGFAFSSLYLVVNVLSFFEAEAGCL